MEQCIVFFVIVGHSRIPLKKDFHLIVGTIQVWWTLWLRVLWPGICRWVDPQLLSPPHLARLLEPALVVLGEPVGEEGEADAQVGGEVGHVRGGGAKVLYVGAAVVLGAGTLEQPPLLQQRLDLAQLEGADRRAGGRGHGGGGRGRKRGGADGRGPEDKVETRSGCRVDFFCFGEWLLSMCFFCLPCLGGNARDAHEANLGLKEKTLFSKFN